MQKVIKGLTVYKIWYWGIGIASLPDWKKVLIKWGALPWSIVDVRVVNSKKDYIEAHLLEIKKQDPKLITGHAICQHFFSPFMEKDENNNLPPYAVWCWWCKWQVMNYDAQLKLKEDIVKDAFWKLLKKQEITFLPIVGSPLQEGYRNKIEFSFWVYKQLEENFRKAKKSWRKEEDLLKEWMKKYSIDANFNLWFHKQWEFSKIVDVSHCWLVSEKVNKLFSHLKDLCKESGLSVYDQKNHQWFFRHLVIREWFNTNQILVNLSVSDNNLQWEDTELWSKFMENLKEDAILKEEVSTFVISYNNWLADIIRNSETEIKTFWWEGAIYEILDFSEFVDNSNKGDEKQVRVNFRISPSSFFQTNTLWAQKLFWTAMNMVGRIEWNILDLYCWAWSIWLSFLKSWVWEELVWVEIVEEAIVDAWHNAKINWVENKCYFVASPAEKMLINFPELEEKIKNIWLVIIDPPREWLHVNVIKYLSDLKKQYNFKLLYISCNPITMARDIELLVEEWFKFKEIQPVDLFPHTHHIEDICVMS